MKVHYVTGCTAFSLNVDGKEEINMSDEERLDVIENIYCWLKRHPDDLNVFLQIISKSFGEYNCISDTPCECCGDIVDEMILDLNL